jgi:uncharacterized protein (DUF1015 family)
VPRFQPFRGLRYNPELVRLQDVIAPPYDVITPTERVRLATRSPANAVHVELPEADLASGRNRYQVAAALFQQWRQKQILIADPSPSLYPYRMTSTDGRSSTGVLGALGLPSSVSEEDDILPHEQTLPKAKSDRLDLLRATQANLSPIWGLSMTPGLTATYEPLGRPAGEAFDDDGVLHQIWVLDDPAAIDAVGRAVAAAPVVIADGHHRYETARAYRQERAQEPGDEGGPQDSVLALLVELTDEQVSVGAIHRTLTGFPDGTDPATVLSTWFEAVRAGPATESVVGALATSDALALVTADGAWILTARPDALKAASSDLDSSLLALVGEELPNLAVAHRHSWQEAFDAVTTGEAEAAVLLRPLRAGHIAQWAETRRRMPPKTTYFRPKPRTGMVFRVLES